MILEPEVNLAALWVGNDSMRRSTVSKAELVACFLFSDIHPQVFRPSGVSQ